MGLLPLSKVLVKTINQFSEYKADKTKNTYRHGRRRTDIFLEFVFHEYKRAPVGFYLPQRAQVIVTISSFHLILVNNLVATLSSFFGIA